MAYVKPVGNIHESHGGDSFPDKLLRTLQRRVKSWCHQEGPACEVMFRQEHVPGDMGLSDFTELKELNITIQGKVLKHLLYHFRVIYSGWSYLKVVPGGESYAALTEGLQNALWCFGGNLVTKLCRVYGQRSLSSNGWTSSHCSDC